MSVLDEQVVTLKEAATFIGTFGICSPHQTTMWRWATKGVRGVRLEHVRFGRLIVTSREAIVRFSERLAESWRPP